MSAFIRRLLVALYYILIVVTVSSCSKTLDTERLRISANALLDASEQCVYDVRDRKLKYETAPNCTALSALSKQYIDAGGGQPDTPVEIEIDFERARVHAWMARALSESKEPGLVSIW